MPTVLKFNQPLNKKIVSTIFAAFEVPSDFTSMQIHHKRQMLVLHGLHKNHKDYDQIVNDYKEFILRLYNKTDESGNSLEINHIDTPIDLANLQYTEYVFAIASVNPDVNKSDIYTELINLGVDNISYDEPNGALRIITSQRTPRGIIFSVVAKMFNLRPLYAANNNSPTSFRRLSHEFLNDADLT